MIIHQEEHIDSKLHCGIISKEYFLLTREFYIEGQHRNTCLNEKISIDVNGEVKNCPSMIDSYGNIMNDNLMKILNNESFRKHWNITKDQIHVCKDCEFIYVCTDFRAYVEEPSDIYSKPLKCGYNPYEGRWDEWNKDSKKRDILANYNLI